jgi:hypothetical protein
MWKEVACGRSRAAATAASTRPVSARGALARLPAESASRTARSTAAYGVRPSAKRTSALAGCTFTSTRCSGASRNRKAS